jgi:uncharacterized protein
MRAAPALLALAVTLSASAVAAQSPRYTGPIVDVHLHSYPAGPLGGPPLRAVRPDFPAPYADVAGSSDGAAQMRATLDQLRRNNVTQAIQVYAADENDLPAELAVARDWASQSDGHVVTGVSLRPLTAKTSPEAIAAAYRKGEVVALGELAIQYIGRNAADPAYAPYLVMAEREGMPVAIHTGSGPPRSSAHGSPDFRLRHGNPLLIEDVLVRYPKLRVSLMHAGWPYLQEIKGLLNQYPEVYVDLGAISWVLPKAEFYAHLKALIDAGFADRIMYGSDQMAWPATIGLAIDAVQSAPFLTTPQKQAILHDNAVRFYKLKER